jgi:hypothetical protein
MSSQAELLSKDIVELQDVEKIQYLQALQADPAKYSQYVQGKSNAILTEAVDTKRASFVKVSGDMARMMDMDHNSQAVLLRSQDLLTTQDHIYKEQNRMKGSKKTNEDLTRRQVEINDWYYENKRETLFVLQLVLLTALVVVIILAFKSYGWIGEAGGNYILLFIIMVALGTWLYRWYYTRNIRDRRYWNNRKFEADGTVAPDNGCLVETNN